MTHLLWNMQTCRVPSKSLRLPVWYVLSTCLQLMPQLSTKPKLPSCLQVDVYAFSMIAYELFEGAIPFEHLHPVEAARRAAMNHARPTWGKTNNRWASCDAMQTAAQQQTI